MACKPGAWLQWQLDLTSATVDGIEIHVDLAPGWNGTIDFNDLNLEPLFLT